MTATLSFRSIANPDIAVEVNVDGCQHLEHATIIGHGLTGTVSAQQNAAFYLSGVTCINGDFLCLPEPSYFQEHVTLRF